MDEGLIGGLIGLAIAAELVHCLNCGGSFKSGSKRCPHCGKKM